jgi:hypothetical protein
MCKCKYMHTYIHVNILCMIYIYDLYMLPQTVKILETCLRREKGCFTVPGLGNI